MSAEYIKEASKLLKDTIYQVEKILVIKQKTEADNQNLSGVGMDVLVEAGSSVAVTESFQHSSVAGTDVLAGKRSSLSVTEDLQHALSVLKEAHELTRQVQEQQQYTSGFRPGMSNLGSSDNT